MLALLMATLLTLLWPLTGLSSLVQGALLTVLMVVPAMIGLWIVGLTQGKNKRGSYSENEEEAIVAAAPYESQRHAEPVASKGQTSNDSYHDALREAKTSWKKGEADQQRGGFDPAAQDQNVALNTFASANESSGTQSARKLDATIDDDDYDYETPAELQEQLDKVSELVQTHDLSDHSSSPKQARKNWREIRESHDRHTAESKDLISVDASNASDLEKLSTGEITTLVANLRKDKTRLQKLVIAQQAAIDSERQAHDQSRTVARDAIKIMRDAREAQKFAEKLARRERSERRRIEQQYKKVAGALDNALSIIESRKKNSVADDADTLNAAFSEDASEKQSPNPIVQEAAEPVQRDVSA